MSYPAVRGTLPRVRSFTAGDDTGIHQVVAHRVSEAFLDAAGYLAELLGRLVGFLARRDVKSSALEIAGGSAITTGLAGWSTELALIAVGIALFLMSWRMNRNARE